MSSYFARLKTDWMLRGWSDSPRTVVNWVNGHAYTLSNLGFYVAQACDGQTDFDSFAFLPKHRVMLDRLIAEGIAETCQAGTSIETWQQFRQAVNPRLTGIHWCVTGLCNLNCRHCYMQAPGGRYGQLPLRLMRKLVEQFERANVLEVTLTGGEPFLRPDLLEIIQLLVEKKIRIPCIYSNGLLITDQHLEAMRRIGVRPSFQISFDGVGTHDYMRGTTGIESRVLEAIRRIRTAGFRVVVATCIDMQNAKSLPGTYERMKELDIRTWRIAIPLPTGNWRGNQTTLSLEERYRVCLPLAERWFRDGQPFAVEFCGMYIGIPVERTRTISQGRLPRRKSQAGHSRVRSRQGATGMAIPDRPEYTPEMYDCSSCRESPNLLPDGTLVPCPGYVDTFLQDQMPNLLREDLSQAWTRSRLRDIAEIRKKDLFRTNQDCATCDLFPECGMGCRASAIVETGNLMSKDPITCELYKKGYKKRFREAASSVA